MRLKNERVLNPRPMPRDNLVGSVKPLQGFLIQSDQLKLKKSQILALRVAQNPFGGSNLRFDNGIGDICALSQEKKIQNGLLRCRQYTDVSAKMSCAISLSLAERPSVSLALRSSST